MKYRCIDGHRGQFALELMCRVLGVSRSGYYAWKSRGPSRRSKQDRALLQRIQAIHAGSRRSYGSPRIHEELRRQGIGCGRGKVARLMRRARLRGIAARRRRPRMTTVDRRPLANEVQRHFAPGEINRVWASDLTYIRTREGWLFLAVVLDVGSRRVVGWAMAGRPDCELVLRALDMAIVQRQPAPGLVHHSDRGLHYTSARYRKQLEQNGLRASYSGLGDCWDNAVVESFFHSLKTEEAFRPYPSRREARHRLFEYIEVWYNRKRRHSTLGQMSPAEYEERR